MTISQALTSAAIKFKAIKIKSPHLEAEILLSGIIKKPREFLLTHAEYQLTDKQISNFKLQISRRLKGEPIAYLTGHKEFYGLDFLVNKDVLIPRPETESLVEEALKLVTRDSRPVTLVDVGTGSGCIIISLVKNLTPKFPTRLPDGQVSNFQFLATDISKSALATAKKNAKLHNLDKKIKFVEGDLLEPLIKSKIENRLSSEVRRLADEGGNSKLIILANLPYGWPAWKNNCSMDTVGLKFEPAIALFTDKNGLALYEKLFKQIKKLAARLRATCYVLCEFDPRQTAKIKRLIKQKLPQAECQIKKDLAGLNRLAILRISK